MTDKKKKALEWYNKEAVHLMSGNDHHETIREALTEPQWQTIDMAPKDGSKFLGHSHFGHTETISWDKDHERFMDMVTDFIPDNCLTHWLPLPIAPTGDGS